MAFRKPLIFIIAAIFLFFIIVSVFLLLQQRASSTETPSQTQTPSQNRPRNDNQRETAQPNPTTQPQSQRPERFGTENVTFLLDSAWKATREDRQGGENIVIQLKEPGRTDPEQSLSIFTEESFSESRLKDLDTLYTGLGYTKETKTFQNNIAIQYTGVAPYPIPESTQFANLQDRAIILVINQKMYIIKYHYVSDERIPSLDSQFEAIIATMEL